MATWKKALTVVFAVVGILAVLVGVIYVAEPAKSIPSFFPAYKAGSHFHATKHGAGGNRGRRRPADRRGRPAAQLT